MSLRLEVSLYRMKLLLTSSGISNPSIEAALVDLLGKPIAESSALVIPTAIYPFPDGPAGAWRAICGKTPSPLCDLGRKSMGVLELTALPSIKEESWVPLVRDTDALLVWGGHVMYLVTGCESRGWRTSCRRWTRRSTWASARGAW
jgi:dipeptidase E